MGGLSVFSKEWRGEGNRTGIIATNTHMRICSETQTHRHTDTPTYRHQYTDTQRHRGTDTKERKKNKRRLRRCLPLSFLSLLSVSPPAVIAQLAFHIIAQPKQQIGHMIPTFIHSFWAWDTFVAWITLATLWHALLRFSAFWKLTFDFLKPLWMIVQGPFPDCTIATDTCAPTGG